MGKAFNIYIYIFNIGILFSRVVVSVKNQSAGRVGFDS